MKVRYQVTLLTLLLLVNAGCSRSSGDHTKVQAELESLRSQLDERAQALEAKAKALEEKASALDAKAKRHERELQEYRAGKEKTEAEVKRLDQEKFATAAFVVQSELKRLGLLSKDGKVSAAQRVSELEKRLENLEKK